MVDPAGQNFPRIGAKFFQQGKCDRRTFQSVDQEFKAWRGIIKIPHLAFDKRKKAVRAERLHIPLERRKRVMAAELLFRNGIIKSGKSIPVFHAKFVAHGGRQSHIGVFQQSREIVGIRSEPRALIIHKTDSAVVQKNVLRLEITVNQQIGTALIFLS